MKIIEVSNCRECPYSEYSNVYYKCSCLRTGNTLNRLLEIQPDCPLKDECKEEPSMYEVMCK